MKDTLEKSFSKRFVVQDFREKLIFRKKFNDFSIQLTNISKTLIVSPIMGT